MTFIIPSALCIVMLLIRTDVTYGLKCYACSPLALPAGFILPGGLPGGLFGDKSCDQELTEPSECSRFSSTKSGPEMETMVTSPSPNGTGEPQLQAGLRNTKYVCTKAGQLDQIVVRGCVPDLGQEEGCRPDKDTKSKTCFCRTDGCNAGGINGGMNSLTGSLYWALGLGILTSGLTTLNF